jgi:ribosomal protein L14E/L6E/L27E
MSQLIPEPEKYGIYKRLSHRRTAVQTGHLVRSAMGRDRGRFYLVISSDGLSKVQVADGEVRKVENPKHKKIKHLHVYDVIADGLLTKTESGKRITNVDIRRELKSLLQNDDRYSK